MYPYITIVVPFHLNEREREREEKEREEEEQEDMHTVSSSM